MIRDLVKSDDSILHRRIEPCGVNVDRHFISKTLIENMLYYNGVGLSANQIGIQERAFCMMIDVETEETITCFNPRIIKSYSKEVVLEEGCLSYPGVFLDAKRPDSVVVKYEDANGKLHKEKLTGFTSRVFQHEYDHMEGIDFTQRKI
jgi:peptide deformylase